MVGNAHIVCYPLCVRCGPVENNQKLHQPGRLERLDITWMFAFCEDEMPALRPLIPVPINGVSNGSADILLWHVFGLR